MKTANKPFQHRHWLYHVLNLNLYPPYSWKAILQQADEAQTCPNIHASPQMSEHNHPISLCLLWFSCMSPRAGYCEKTFDHPCHHTLTQWKKLGHLPRVPCWMEKREDNGNGGTVTNGNVTRKGCLSFLCLWMLHMSALCRGLFCVCVCVMSHELSVCGCQCCWRIAAWQVQQQHSATGWELWLTARPTLPRSWNTVVSLS